MSLNNIKERLLRLPPPDVVRTLDPKNLEAYVREVHSLRQEIEMEKAQALGVLKAHEEEVARLKESLKARYGTDDLAELLKLRDSMLDSVELAKNRALEAISKLQNNNTLTQ